LTLTAPVPVGDQIGAERVERVGWDNRLRILARRWGAEAAAISLVGIAAPLLIAIHYRSLGVPSADDWAYDLSVYRLAFHGHLYLYHWARINLLGQVVLAVPVVWIFGEHAWALNAFGCVMGAVGLMSIIYLGRKLGLNRWTALFAACVLGLGPMWATLSTSFMTDVPSLAAMSLALAVAASDDRVDRLVTPRSLTALLIAAFAFTIRDEAGVVFAVIAICRLTRCGRVDWRRSTGWLAAVGAVGAAMAVFYLWRLPLPSGGGTSNKATSTFAQWWDSEWLFPLAGLMLSPVALAVRPLKTMSSAWRSCRGHTLAGWAVMPIGPVLIFLAHHLAIIRSGQSVTVKMAELAPQFGDYYFNFDGMVPGGAPYLAGWMDFLLGCAAVASLTVIVASVVLAGYRWRRQVVGRDRSSPLREQRSYVAQMLTLATVGELAVFVALIEMQLVTWDRYLLHLVPYCGLLLLYAHQRSIGPGDRAFSPVTGVVALALLATLCGAVTIANDGYMGSEWAYSQKAAGRVPGTPPALIYTDWTWSSTQNRVMVNPFAANLSPWYVPCYEETYNQPATAGAFDVRRGGSWVQPVTFELVRNPSAKSEAACHF
jgi:hypothetical protein